LAPAWIRITPGEGGFGLSIDAPENGWRLVDLNGDARGENPVLGLLELQWEGPDGVLSESQEANPMGQSSWLEVQAPQGATRLVVEDALGNQGHLDL